MSPVEAMLHGPVPAPWSMDEWLWVPGDVRGGVGCGYRWATDNATAAMEPAVNEPDGEDSKLCRQVVDMLGRDRDRWWPMEWDVLSVLGGIAHVEGWGAFDLDRVRTAALWVLDDADDEGLEVTVEATTSSDRLRRDTSLLVIRDLHTGRTAAVIGVLPPEDPESAYQWLPTITLPEEAR